MRTTAKKQAFIKAAKAKIGKESSPPEKPTPIMPPLGTALIAKSFSHSLEELLSVHLCDIHSRKSLLCCQKELSKLNPRENVEGALSALYRLASTRREDYAKMLAIIMSGASVNSAVSFAAISPTLFVEWRRIGVRDYSSGRDTIAARFVQDINFAATVPGIEAESTVRRKNPLEWLRYGPGRWLHPEGTWQQERRTRDSEEPPPETTGIAESPRIVEDQEETDLFANAPTIADLPDALITLRQVGLDNVIEESVEEARRRNELRSAQQDRKNAEAKSGSGIHSPGANGNAASNGKPSG